MEGPKNVVELGPLLHAYFLLTYPSFHSPTCFLPPHGPSELSIGILKDKRLQNRILHTPSSFQPILCPKFLWGFIGGCLLNLWHINLTLELVCIRVWVLRPMEPKTQWSYWSRDFLGTQGMKSWSVANITITRSSSFGGPNSRECLS